MDNQQFFRQSEMSDPIENLPIPQTPVHPNHNELKIVDTIFKENRPMTDRIVHEFKEPAIIALLFIIVSMPQIDEMIAKFIPSIAGSPYMILGLKAIVLGLMFWLIKNFVLAKKN